MKDTQALAFLLKAQGEPKLGRQARAAAEIGVSPECLSMWHGRGIPSLMRFRVLEVLNRHGAKLPTTWAKPRRLNGGKANCRARIKSKAAKGKRPRRKARPQQRRSAARGRRPLVGKNRGGAGRGRARSEAAQVAQG
jgi:hypothetical protein